MLEEAWTGEQGPRRLFLQALIHCAVGMYHWQRGNMKGAAGQLRKGLAKLDSYLPDFEGIDTARLHRDVGSGLAAIEAGADAMDLPRIYLAPI